MSSQPEQSRSLRLWSALFGAHLVSRVVGAALMPALLVGAPWALVMLSPLVHHLVSAAALMPGWLFVLCGATTSVAHSTIAYEFGARAGERVHGWLEDRGVDQAKRQGIERRLGRCAPLFIALVPSPIVCLLAGAIEVRRAHFYVVIAPAQIGWMCVFMLCGAACQEFMASVQAFLAANLLWFTLAGVALLGLHYGKKRLKERRALADS